MDECGLWWHSAQSTSLQKLGKTDVWISALFPAGFLMFPWNTMETLCSVICFPMNWVDGFSKVWSLGYHQKWDNKGSIFRSVFHCFSWRIELTVFFTGAQNSWIAVTINSSNLLLLVANRVGKVRKLKKIWMEDTNVPFIINYPEMIWNIHEINWEASWLWYCMQKDTGSQRRPLKSEEWKRRGISIFTVNYGSLPGNNTDV